MANRFNSYSYYKITEAIDSHNIGRGRGGLKAAFGRIKAKCYVIAISTDLLYPIESNEIIANGIKGAKLFTIESPFGHDGFLVEHDILNNIILNIENGKE